MLEYHLADQASADRAEVLEAIARGESLEEASADYVSDGAFEEGYGAFCEALCTAAGK